MTTTRAVRLTLLAILALCTTGFSRCYTTPGGLFDQAVSTNDQWVVTLTNTDWNLQPAPGNSATAESFDPRYWFTGPCSDGSIATRIVGDPQIIADRADGRFWFAVIVQETNVSGTPFVECLFASAGTDPRGPYLREYFSRPAIADGLWLGVTSDKVTLTGLFVDAFRTLVLNKADLLAQVDPRFATYDVPYGTRPVQNVDTSRPDLALYAAGGATGINIGAVTGVPGIGGGPLYASAVVPTTWAGFSYEVSAGPRIATQPDGQPVSFPSETSGMYNGGRLWWVHVGPQFFGLPFLAAFEITDVVPDSIPFPIGALYAPQLAGVQTAGPPDGVGAGSSLGCPTVVVRNDGLVILGASAASPSHYLSAYTTFGSPLLGPVSPWSTVLQGAATTEPCNWSIPGGCWRLDYCTGALALNGYTRCAAQAYLDGAGGQSTVTQCKDD